MRVGGIQQKTGMCNWKNWLGVGTVSYQERRGEERLPRKMSRDS